MARFATPGVYVKEKNAFSSSVVATPTAIPAFIGYTNKAERGGKNLINIPTKINSLKEYLSFFGKGNTPTFRIKPKSKNDFELTPDKETQFNLYNSLRLFFANGGGVCYIVSVGNYKSGGVKLDDLRGGLNQLISEPEPSMVVCPDSTLLNSEECHALYRDMLEHCGGITKNRIAIFDIHNGNKERTYQDDDIIKQFREGIGHNHLAYGAAYYPWVETTITSSTEVSFKNVSNQNELIKFLTDDAESNFNLPKRNGDSDKKDTPAGPKGGGPKKQASFASASVMTASETRVVHRFEAVKSEISRIKNANGSSPMVNQNLKAISPAYNKVLKIIREQLNVQAPSGIIAGIMAMVDNTVGVHKAPANVGMNTVLKPTTNITSFIQEDLNLPVDGKAVNAIRSFVGKGTLIWGARTLDGNSQDWRYINVRRTLIMIEQSVKSAIENFVFATNDTQTWLKVKVSIENFLTKMWKQGALMGISPAEAYDVSIGLGETMTPEDVLDGVMRVAVNVSITRPAEFVELTFEQRMQEGVDEGGEGEEGGDEGGEE